MQILALVLLIPAISSQSEWLEIAPAGAGPPPRRGHNSASLVQDGAIIAFGGENDYGLLGDTWIFSFGTHQWSNYTPSVGGPSKRKWPIFGRLSDTEIMLFGGFTYSPSNEPMALSDMWTFSRVGGWNSITSSSAQTPSARFGHASMLENSAQKKVLVFGGAFYDSTGKLALLNDLWRFQKVNSTFLWTKIDQSNNTNIPVSRYGHTTLAISGKMYLFGGSQITQLLNDLWVFDPSKNLWGILGTTQAPSARAFHGGCAMGLNIIIHGGEIEDPSLFSSETWSYDSFNNNWNLLNDVTAPQAAAQHRFNGVSDTVCTSFGGTTSDATAVSTLREITSHPTDAKWKAIVPSRGIRISPAARELFAAAIFDVPSDVIMSNAVDQPSSTAQFSRPQLWIFGGKNVADQILEDIWVFDVKIALWTQKILSDEGRAMPSPGPHFGADSVPYNHFAILSGGSLKGSALWAFNINVLRWTEIIPMLNASLLRRSMHEVLVTSSLVASLILYGGKSPSGMVLGDVVQLPLTRIQLPGTNTVLYFNGLSNYVQLFSDRFTPDAKSGFSVEAMFFIDAAVSDGLTIVSWAAASGNYMRIFYEVKSGTLCVGPDIYVESRYVACGKTRVDDDRWHHVLVSFGAEGSGHFDIFVDGKSDQRPKESKIGIDFSVEITSIVAGNTPSISIPYLVKSQTEAGVPSYRRVNNQPYFSGYIDNVRIWPFYATPHSLGYFPDNVTFPTPALTNKSQAFGSWDFDIITPSFTTPDDSGVWAPSSATAPSTATTTAATTTVAMTTSSLSNTSAPTPTTTTTASTTSTTTTTARSTSSTVGATTTSQARRRLLDTGASAQRMAVLGTGTVVESRPTAVSFSLPQQYTPTVTWTVGPVITVSDQNLTDGVQAPLKRYNHAAEINEDNIYVFGGQNDTDVLCDSWTFNLLLQQWTRYQFAVTDGCVGASLTYYTPDSGPALLALGGTGDSTMNVSELAFSQTEASIRTIPLNGGSLSEVPIGIGHGLSVDYTGHFTALLPNASMAIIFGGRLINRALPDTFPRDTSYFLSNRIFVIDLSTQGSAFTKFRPEGNQPSNGAVFPFAVSPSLGEALYFLGKMQSPIWAFNYGVTSWRSISPTPVADQKPAGYAILTDGNSYQFIGHHCNDFDPDIIETDENCKISTRVYTLDMTKLAWTTTEQTTDHPSSTTLDGAAGGVLEMYPDYCAYDGTTSQCGETFFDPTQAALDIVDDGKIHVANGPEGSLLAVWTSGTSIRASFFDAANLVWKPSTPLFSTGVNTSPRTAYNPVLNEWLVIFSTTASLGKSGSDGDIVLMRNPYPILSKFCVAGQPLPISKTTKEFPIYILDYAASFSGSDVRIAAIGTTPSEIRNIFVNFQGSGSDSTHVIAFNAAYTVDVISNGANVLVVWSNFGYSTSAPSPDYTDNLQFTTQAPGTGGGPGPGTGTGSGTDTDCDPNFDDCSSSGSGSSSSEDTTSVDPESMETTLPSAEDGTTQAHGVGTTAGGPSGGTTQGAQTTAALVTTTQAATTAAQVTTTRAATTAAQASTTQAAAQAAPTQAATTAAQVTTTQAQTTAAQASTQHEAETTTSENPPPPQPRRRRLLETTVSDTPDIYYARFTNGELVTSGGSIPPFDRLSDQATSLCSGDTTLTSLSGSFGTTLPLTGTCTWTITGTSDVKFFEVYIRQLPFNAGKGINGAIGIYDGPGVSVYPALATTSPGSSGSQAMSRCLNELYSADGTATSSRPASIVSKCNFMTSSNSFAVAFLSNAHLTGQFVVSYRAIVGTALNANPGVDTPSEDDPAIASNGNNVVVLWGGNNDATGTTALDDHDIWVKTSSDFGLTWTAQRPLDPNAATDTLDDYYPMVTWPTANVVAACWMGTGNGGTKAVLFSVSSDAGATWSPAMTVASLTGRSLDFPKLAFNGNAWVLVWTTDGYGTVPSNKAVVFSRCPLAIPAAGCWSTMAPLYAGTELNFGRDFALSINTAGPVFVVSWSSGNNFQGMMGTDNDAMVSESVDNGRTWTVPLSPVSSATDPQTKSGSWGTRAFSVQSGPQTLRGMIYGLTDLILVWYTWFVPGNAAIEQCPKIQDWSSPALTDESFFRNDGGIDEYADLILTKDKAVIIWESTNPIGSGSSFPVTGLYSRYLLRTISLDYLLISQDTFSENSAPALNTLDLEPGHFFTEQGGAPVLYEVLNMHADFASVRPAVVSADPSGADPNAAGGAGPGPGQSGGAGADTPTAIDPNADLHVLVTRSEITDYPTTAISYSLWIKNELPGTGSLITWFCEAETEFGTYGRGNLAILNGGTQISFRSTIDQDLPTDVLDLSSVFTPYLDNAWHHLVYAFDVSGALITVYVDKTLLVTLDIGGTDQKLESTGYLFVGASMTDYGYNSYTKNQVLNAAQIFIGRMSDFITFNRVVSASDVSSLYDLNTKYPNANLRYQTAPISTMAFFPSQWINPGASSSAAYRRPQFLRGPNVTDVDVYFSTSEPSVTGSTDGDSDTAHAILFSNGTWTPPLPIAPHVIGADQAALPLQCGSNFVIIFTSEADFSGVTGSDADIFFSIMKSGPSNSYTIPAALNSDAATDAKDDVEPSLLYEGGLAIVTWVSVDSTFGTRLMVSRSFDDCLTWSDATPLSSEVDVVPVKRRNPVVLSLAAHSVVYQRQVSGTDVELGLVQMGSNPVFFCYLDSFVETRYVHSVSNDWVRDVGVSAAKSGYFIAAYTLQDPAKMQTSGGGIYVSRLNPSGNWESQIAINRNDSVPLNYISPAVACNDAGVAVLVWSDQIEYESSLYAYRVRASVSTDNGATWDQNIKIIYVTPLLTSPATLSLSIDTDGADIFTIVWSVSDPSAPLSTGTTGDRDIIWCRYTHSTKNWTAPDILNRNARGDIGDDLKPSVTYDRGLHTWLVSWESNSALSGKGTDFDIVLATMPYTDFDAFCNVDELSTQISEAHDDKANGLSTAASDNYVVISWHSKHATPWDSVGSYGTDLDIFLSWSCDFGQTFSTINYALPYALSDSVRNDYFPRVVFAGNSGSSATFVVAWHSDLRPSELATLRSSDSTNSRSVFAISVAVGVNVSCTASTRLCPNGTRFDFTSPVVLTTTAAASRASTSESSGLMSNGLGYVALVYADASASQGNALRMVSSQDYGMTWSNSTTLNITSGGVLVDPRIAMTSTKSVLVAYGISLDDNQNADFDLFIWTAVPSVTMDAASWTWTAVKPQWLNRQDTGDDINCVVAGRGNTWVIVWQSNDNMANILGGGVSYGFDWDIVFTTSTDGGATWSSPKAINSYAASDFYADLNPSIAVNAAGVFVVTWITDGNVGALTGEDRDTMLSESSDGLSWSDTRAANANFEDDNQDESDLSVSAVSNSNTMIASWTCCKAGSASFYLRSWSGLLRNTNCNKKETWSYPQCNNPLCSTDGVAVDSSVATATDGNGTVVSIWQSNSNTLSISRGPPSSIALWWPLTAAYFANSRMSDISGSGIIGSATGLTSTMFTGSGAKFPAADSTFVFAGKSYIATNFTASLPFPTSAFTVSFWVQFTKGSSGTQFIFSKTVGLTSNITDITMYVNTKTNEISGSVGARDGTLSKYNLTDYTVTVPGLTDGKWHHMAFGASSSLHSFTIFVDTIPRLVMKRSLQSISATGRVLLGAGSCNSTCNYKCAPTVPPVAKCTPPVYLTCCSSGLYYQGKNFTGSIAHMKIFKTLLNVDDIISMAIPSELPTIAASGTRNNFDIMYSTRRSDNTWTLPAILNSNSASDSLNDTSPSLTYASSKWTAAWLQYSLDLEADPFYSTRAGSTGAWSPLAAANARAAQDSESERSLVMASNGTANVALACIGAGGGSKSKILVLDLDSTRTHPVDPKVCAIVTFAAPSAVMEANFNASSTIFKFFSSNNLLHLDGDKFLTLSEGSTSMATIASSGLFLSIMNAKRTFDTTLLSFTGPSLPISRAKNRTPTAAMNEDGRIALVWCDTLNGKRNIFLLPGQRSDFGVTFDKVSLEPFDPTPGDAVYPKVIVGKFNAFFLVWVSQTSSGALIYGAISDTSDKTLATWTRPMLLMNVTKGSIGPPSVKYDNDNTIVVVASCVNTTGLYGKDSDIMFVRSTDGGKVWSEPLPLNTNAKFDGNAIDDAPSVTLTYLSDYSFFCVWSSTSSLRNMIGTDRDILFAYSEDFGATWSDPLPVNSDAAMDTYPDENPNIDCDDSFCVVAWTRTAFSDKDIFIADTVNGGKRWSRSRYMTATQRSDSANDDNAKLLMADGLWAMSLIADSTLHFSLFSNRQFQRGLVSNIGGSDSAVIALSDFGQRVWVDTDSDTLRVGYYGLNAVRSTANSTKIDVYMYLYDSIVSSRIEATGEITAKERFVSGLGRSNLGIKSRWDYAAVVIPFSNPVTAESESLLIVQGGKTASGFISSLVLHEPVTGQWEQVMCQKGTSLPRFQGHSMKEYSTQSGYIVFIYGNDPLTRDTKPDGVLYDVSGLQRTQTSPMFSRAAAFCNLRQPAGDAPKWNRNQRITILRTYLFVVDSSDGASSREMIAYDIPNNKWFAVPSVHNPVKTSGYFSLFMVSGVMFVLSTGETIGMKSTDFDRLNPKKCSAASPFGNYLVAAAAGERAVVDVTALSSLDRYVTSGSDLSLALVSSTGLRIRGQLNSNPTLGVYRFVYTAKVPGKYDLRISAFGTYIGPTASVYAVEISPGAASLLTTTVDTSAFNTVQANVLFTFEINSRDAFGNNVLGGDDVKVFVIQNTTTVAVVTDNFDGSYLVGFTVTKAGAYSMSTLLNSFHISGSPFTFKIDPGPPQGGLSKVVGADLGQAPSGKGQIIKIGAVDAAGNPLSAGLGADAVKVVFYDTTQPAPGRRAGYATVNPDDIPTLVTDNGDGTYQVAYFPFVDGTFTFTIQVAGVPVPGSPFPLAIQPVFEEPDSSGPMFWLVLIVLLSNGLGACCHVGIFQRFFSLIRGRRMRAQNSEQKNFPLVVPNTTSPMNAQVVYVPPIPALDPDQDHFMLLL